MRHKSQFTRYDWGNFRGEESKETAQKDLSHYPEGVVSVSFLGPIGTNTDSAVSEFAESFAPLRGQSITRIPFSTPGGALDAVRHGEADYACVAIESSVEGAVAPTLDALASGSRLQIVAETGLDIVFSILVRPGMQASDVKTFATHPIALAQVVGWLDHNLPHAVRSTVSSTAAGAQAVQQGTIDATAAPQRAGDLHQLESLANGVADHTQARTRFVLVSRPVAPLPATGKDRSSLVFTVTHEPNALVQALTEFSTRGLNLTRIESRPTKEEKFTYNFHIDVDGHIEDPLVGEAFSALHRRCSRLRFLGSWPCEDNTVPPTDISSHSRWLEAMSQGRESQ